MAISLLSLNRFHRVTEIPSGAGQVIISWLLPAFCPWQDHSSILLEIVYSHLMCEMDWKQVFSTLQERKYFWAKNRIPTGPQTDWNKEYTTVSSPDGGSISPVQPGTPDKWSSYHIRICRTSVLCWWLTLSTYFLNNCHCICHFSKGFPSPMQEVHNGNGLLLWQQKAAENSREGGGLSTQGHRHK